jgi:hypothetical protein
MIGRLLCRLGCHKRQVVTANNVWFFEQCARPGCSWASRPFPLAPYIGGLIQRPNTDHTVESPHDRRGA